VKEKFPNHIYLSFYSHHMHYTSQK